MLGLPKLNALSHDMHQVFTVRFRVEHLFLKFANAKGEDTSKCKTLCVHLIGVESELYRIDEFKAYLIDALVQHPLNELTKVELHMIGHDYDTSCKGLFQECK